MLTPASFLAALVAQAAPATPPAAPAAVLPTATGPLFTEIGAQALPGVTTRCGSPDKNFIIEVNGGGVLAADFDADGNIDVVIVDGSTLERIEKGEPGFPPRLFLGKGDGTFAPAGESWAMAGGRWGMGGAVGDLDNDGWLDLVITEWGPDRVFLNAQGKGFHEHTAKAGLDREQWGTSAALLDYDEDGKLDLFVVNYLVFDPKRVGRPGEGDCRWKGHDVMCGPEGLAAERSLLYRGNGDGSFEDVTQKAKIAAQAPGFGLGAMTLDYDVDGDVDVFVANDSTPNHLWENQGDGTFAEVAFKRGVSHDAQGKEQASMGIGCGDLNGDGRDDLFISNFSGEGDSLYLSSRTHLYRERSSAAGITGPSLAMLGWGATLADFDLDRDLDITLLNGHVYPQAALPGTDTSYVQPGQFYRNSGDGKFTVQPLSALAPDVARASTAADIDNDGDLDLIGLRIQGQVLVFRNDARHDANAHWLRVQLRARHGNRFGLGARVLAEWDGGKHAAEMRTAGGYQASVPPEVHFGLGPVARLARLVVTWPSGKTTIVEDVPVDRVMLVEEAGD